MGQQFYTSLITHGLDTLRYSEGVRQSVLLSLEQLREELTKLIFDINPTAVKSSTYQQKRLKELLDAANKAISSAYSGSYAKTLKDLKDFSSAEFSIYAGLYNRLLDYELFAVAIPVALATELSKDSLIQGAVLKDWWNKQSKDLQMRFATEIRKGMLGGESIDTIRQRITGKSTGKFTTVKVGDKTKRVYEYTGGILSNSKREATALVRTAVLTISNNANLEVLKQNKDVINGVQHISTLDDRTTLLCMSQDGGQWDIETYEPLPTSPVKTKWMGPPPLHFNCRSFIIPVVKTWEELGIDAKELSEGTRAAWKGTTVSEKMTYSDWLKMQNRETQIKVLGKARYNLWKENKLSFNDMIDVRGNPITIKELLEKYEVKP